MKKLIIENKAKLVGEINISGAKNASLPILFATVLFKTEVILANVPNVSDIALTLKLLEQLGAEIEQLDTNKYKINCQNINSNVAPYEIVKQMRASFWILGALLGRLGSAKVSLPGGCAIGNRPVDIHLDAFSKMGVNIINENGYVEAECIKEKIQGTTIDFRFPSVGATHNLIIGAVLAEGKTIINNAAKEPEIVDLANFLNKAGAKIKGAGTETIEIEPVQKLYSVEYTIMGDRIEAGTYMIGAAMTDGDLVLNGLDFFNTLESLITTLEFMGMEITPLSKTSIRIRKKSKKLKPANIITAVYPGYPTDLQAQIMALLAMVDGNSIIDETVFENRFMHIAELNRLGANIIIEKDNKAFIKGKENCYSGTEVMATDLRAGAALMLAGMTTEDKTTIDRYYHIERGYENLVEKLQNCGVSIKLEEIRENLKVE